MFTGKREDTYHSLLPEKHIYVKPRLGGKSGLKYPRFYPRSGRPDCVRQGLFFTKWEIYPFFVEKKPPFRGFFPAVISRRFQFPTLHSVSQNNGVYEGISDTLLIWRASRLYPRLTNRLRQVRVQVHPI